VNMKHAKKFQDSRTHKKRVLCIHINLKLIHLQKYYYKSTYFLPKEENG
jgi:hypothetical protein